MFLLFRPNGRSGQAAPPTAKPTATVSVPRLTPTPTLTTAPSAEGPQHVSDDVCGETAAEAKPGDPCYIDPNAFPFDYQKGMSLSPKVVAFTDAWVTWSSDESAEARADRLRGLGASDEVATQVTGLARANSDIYGLTGSSGPNPGTYASMAAQTTAQGYKFVVDEVIHASYRLPGGTGTDHTLPGNITVVINPDTGTIVSVTENIPDLRSMK
jgi:hypothetical protein